MFCSPFQLIPARHRCRLYRNFPCIGFLAARASQEIMWLIGKTGQAGTAGKLPTICHDEAIGLRPAATRDGRVAR